MNSVRHILFFDGVCNLCNGYVNWVIKRDPSALVSFSSIQSEHAKNMLKKHPSYDKSKDTIYYLKNDTLYYYSDAPLELVKDIGGIYRALYVFKIIPRFIRDSMYKWVAKNRYRIFGKKETCMVPKPEWKIRFLD